MCTSTDVSTCLHTHFHTQVTGAEIDGCHHRIDIDGVYVPKEDHADPTATLCEPRGARCLAAPPWRGSVFQGVRNAGHYQNCAIVGSSGASTTIEYGRAIDAADLVVRFNDAPAGGQYSALVGSRTDFRVGNGEKAMQAALSEKVTL